MLDIGFRSIGAFVNRANGEECDYPMPEVSMMLCKLESGWDGRIIKR